MDGPPLAEGLSPGELTADSRHHSAERCLSVGLTLRDTRAMSYYDGSDLRAERARNHLRQSDIAAAMGVSRGRIAQLEQSRHVSDRVGVRYLAAVRGRGTVDPTRLAAIDELLAALEAEEVRA